MVKKRGNMIKAAVIFGMVMLLAADVVLAAPQRNKRENMETPEEEANKDRVSGKNERTNNALPKNRQKAHKTADFVPDLSEDFAGERAADLLAGMTLEQKVAQMFIITPEALTGYKKVTAAGEVTKQSFSRYPVGGIIYMAGNLIDSEQTRAMLANMADYSMELLGVPVFLAVDEEGGTVARIANNKAFGIKNVGDMSGIGASGDSGKAYEAGGILGGYLADLGFNLDFAPVADVWSNEKNTVVKYRSFGSDALLVRDMVTAQLEGLWEYGILGAVKHFPGHGSTAADSHKGAAVVNKTLEELKECDLIPFEGAIAAGVPFVMVGHLSLPQVAGGDVPAVLSEEIIGNLLREELGFDGIVITDALNMNAITDYYNSAEAAVMAAAAGADMLLMPEDFEAAYQGVLDAVKDGRLTQEQIDAAVLRILKVKVGLLSF